MQITAKLLKVLPIQSGTGQNGAWKKQDIIVETDGQYARNVCISIWGDKINENQLQVGNILIIDFVPDSKEFKDKWYTPLIATNIEISNFNRLSDMGDKFHGKSNIGDKETELKRQIVRTPHILPSQLLPRYKNNLSSIDKQEAGLSSPTSEPAKGAFAKLRQKLEALKFEAEMDTKSGNSNPKHNDAISENMDEVDLEEDEFL